MSATKFCNDPRCMRHIPQEIFDRATAHALGCKVRKSLTGKEAQVKGQATQAKKERLRERGRKAAATRAKRRAEAAYKAVTGEEIAL